MSVAELDVVDSLSILLSEGVIVVSSELMVELELLLGACSELIVDVELWFAGLPS